MKLKLSAFIGIILGLVFLISVSQIILGELFPWLNFTIASGLPLIIYLLSFLIQDKKIITLKVVYSFIILQFFIAIYFLINPVYLKLYWNLLFIPTLLFICFLFLEFALRKNKLVFNILKICIAIWTFDRDWYIRKTFIYTCQFYRVKDLYYNKEIEGRGPPPLCPDCFG